MCCVNSKCLNDCRVGKNRTETYNTDKVWFFSVPWVRQAVERYAPPRLERKSHASEPHVRLSPIRLSRALCSFLRTGALGQRCVVLRQETDGNTVGVNGRRQKVSAPPLRLAQRARRTRAEGMSHRSRERCVSVVEQARAPNDAAAFARKPTCTSGSTQTQRLQRILGITEAVRFDTHHVQQRREQSPMSGRSQF